MAFSMIESLQQVGRARFNAWLDRRIHPTSKITLDQHKIFIFPTREGFLFVLMILAMFFGGVNYENNLVLGLCFFLVGIFVISILHTYRNLSGVVVEASKAEACFVGEEASFTINLSREGSRTHESLCLQWVDGVNKVCELIADREANVLMLLAVDQRGVFTPGRLKIYTDFPLGIIRAWSWLDLNVNCLVYPRSLKSGEASFSSQTQQGGYFSKDQGVDDFAGLRVYQPGDPLKHVHWKALARTGELYSKNFVSSVHEKHWVDWDNFLNCDTETRLSYLCYWVLRFSEGNAVYGLKLPQKVIEPSKGMAHKHRCLSALALYGLVDDERVIRRRSSSERRPPRDSQL